MLKNVIDYFAASGGFKIVADWRMPNLSYTHRLQTLFKYFSITSVIDVGANAGQFRDQMRLEIGFEGSIFSFEPDPTLAAALALRAATDPCWTVFPFALGAETGTKPFNLMKNKVYNSFHQPVLRAVGEFGHGNVVTETTDVEVRTLDAMATIFPDLPHTYLKVDTQGFDLEVLAGGREVMCQIPAVQTEMSLVAQYSGMPLMQASLNAFEDLGFAIADLFLVSKDGQHRAIEFDCIMVKDR